MSDRPNHYRIKYRYKLEKRSPWHYGIVRQYSTDTKKLWKEKYVVIDDAILPNAYKVKYNDLEIIDIPLSYMHGEDEFDDFIRKEYNKAVHKSMRSETMKDQMFSVPVADGFATYIIIRENKRTVHVEWRGFNNPDRYVDYVLGYSGAIDKERVKGWIEYYNGIKSY